MKSLINHLKVALPLYLYPFRIHGVGSYEIGTSIFNLLLPIILILYFPKSKKIALKPLPFVAYMLGLSIIFKPSLLSTINFTFSYIFILYYIHFINQHENAIKDFIISSTIVCFISLVMYIIEISCNIPLSAAQYDKAAFLHIPRLNGIFLEPSHAGIVFSISLMSLFYYKKRISYASVLTSITLVICQSFFGYIILLISFLKKRILIIASILILIFLLTVDINILIKNTGGVRLYGLTYLVKNLNFSDLLIGRGPGYAINFFSSTIGIAYGVEIFNGFFAELFLDIGIIGIIILIKTLTKIGNFTDFVLILIILLFNFGITVPIFPYTLAFLTLYRSKIHKNRTINIIKLDPLSNNYKTSQLMAQ